MTNSKPTRTKITVAFDDGNISSFSSRSFGWGITEDGRRLWIELDDGRIYIMLDRVVHYTIFN